MQNRYLLLSISVVDVHYPIATTTYHDRNYTLQSNINISELFYIRYTQLLIGVISINTSVMIIHSPTTPHTHTHTYTHTNKQINKHTHTEAVIHDYTLQSIINIAKQSRTCPIA